MIHASLLDSLWVIIAAILVFLMQPGFMCLESGLTRSKNSINVAVKNLTDFIISVLSFWLFGYGLMFGMTEGGYIGQSGYMPDFSTPGSSATFFFFQAMFCGTATTIFSGAVAERMKFSSYMIIVIILSTFVYPVFGHWAWNGIDAGTPAGWLGKSGFVDFAGSTVVHSIGGWLALAILLIIGPRTGRFDNRQIFFGFNGSNLPLSVLGTCLLWIGWLGFNGGSTLSMNHDVPPIIVYTILAGAAGALSNLFAGYLLTKVPRVNFLMNGSLGGLVAITACCHCVTAQSAILIGLVAGVICLLVELGLITLKIDDAVGAVPVHLGCGIWGTLCVALFGNAERIGTGLSFSGQLLAQVVGIAAAFFVGFVIPYLLISLINRNFPLRVSLEDEHNGLNFSEHGATTELVDLCMAMDNQVQSRDLSIRMPVEPFTEVGLIAERHNQVMGALEAALSHTEAVVTLAKDAIITFVSDSLEIISINPSGRLMFGFAENASLTGTRLSDLFTPDDYLKIEHPLYRGETVETMGRKQSGTPFPMQAVITDAGKGNNSFYIGTFRDITELKDRERSLRQSEMRYRELFENIGVATIMVGVDTHLIMVNKEAELLFGYDKAKMEQEMCLPDLLPETEKSRILQYHELRRTYPEGVPSAYECNILNSFGTTVPAYFNVSMIAGSDKTVATIVDLTELRDAKKSLDKQKAYFRELFAGSSQAIVALDKKQNIVQVNHSFELLFGYKEKEIKNRSLLNFIVPSSHLNESKALGTAIRNGQMIQKEAVRMHKDGRQIPVSILGFAVTLKDTMEGFFFIYEDITERKEFENQLYRQAFYDGLTDIPNRILFMERMERAVERAKRNTNYSYAVMLLDLDRFKWVNDSLGHLTGDELLRQVAKRFLSCIRSGDTVARLGGDEFAVLVEDYHKPSKILEIAERLQREAQSPFVIGMNDVHVSTSIGIVLTTENYDSTEAILRDADIAMYRAKELGKARYQIFNRSLHDMVSKTMQLENELREAVNNKEMLLYYQPIISMEDRTIQGFEALIRWNHPKRGLIPPDVFIPIAEETGMILDLGDWVVREACSQMKTWQRNRKECRGMTISVNLSAKQFLQKDFVKTIHNILKETKLAATDLKIEITESIIMEGGDQTVEKLNDLREIGIKLAIDDFGTGYSSLSSLHRFPITDLKIDRSFINSLEDNEEAKEIVKTIVSLAQALQLSLVAEGVETEGQFEILKKLSCDKVQGFLFSKPLPVDQMVKFLAQYRA